ncbi:hypothetical protein HK28_03920 [Acetobacter sp. DsW_063]|nr:hypothetical protein HK28_03920 [Acetobacter sp. DsW_063]
MQGRGLPAVGDGVDDHAGCHRYDNETAVSIIPAIALSEVIARTARPDNRRMAYSPAPADKMAVYGDGAAVAASDDGGHLKSRDQGRPAKTQSTPAKIGGLAQPYGCHRNMKRLVQACKLPMIELSHLRLEQERKRFGGREEIRQRCLRATDIRLLVVDV